MLTGDGATSPAPWLCLSQLLGRSQDEREAEEETATSPDICSQRCQGTGLFDTGWAHRPAAGLPGQPGILTEREGDPSGLLRDTWHWKWVWLVAITGCPEVRFLPSLLLSVASG